MPLTDTLRNSVHRAHPQSRGESRCSGVPGITAHLGRSQRCKLSRNMRMNAVRPLQRSLLENQEVAREESGPLKAWGAERSGASCLRPYADDTDSRHAEVLMPRIHQGISSVRGLLKVENQDRVVAMSRMPGSSGAPSSRQNGQVAYSAVFDGHDGSQAATYAAERLHQIVTSDDALRGQLAGSCGSAAAGSPSEDKEQLEQLQHTCHGAFSRLDGEILERSRTSGCVDGATALAGFHTGGRLLVANAGDSRAVLSRDKQALRLTRDHKPGLASERSRIEAVGGKVQEHRGSWRVLLPGWNKICATSRGLGDLHFKDQRLITCEPEVSSTPLLPFTDSFSIFASDGLWGYVDDQDAVDAVMEVQREFSKMATQVSLEMAALAAARKLVKLSLDSGSLDDISVIVNMYDWRPAEAA